MNYPLYLKHEFYFEGELSYETYYAFFEKGRFTKVSIDYFGNVTPKAIQIITFDQQDETHYLTGLLDNKNTSVITKEAFFDKYTEVAARMSEAQNR